MSTEAETTRTPQPTTMPLAKAINAALREELSADERTLLIGEDIGALGGVFRVTQGLQAEFGRHRVMDSPLAESGIIGSSIGLAMRGYRPVAEIQFDGFVFPSFNQITTQLAKIHNRTDGAVSVPVTIRLPYGGESDPLSTTRSPRRRSSPTRLGCASSHRPTRMTPIG